MDKIIENRYFICMIAYLAFTLGIAVESVGEVPTLDTDPYTWIFVVKIMAVALSFTIFGFLAGNEYSG